MNKQNENNNIKIKICGIKNIKILNYLIKNSIDFYGLIFYEKSPRFVDINIATNLVNISKNTKINPVGVFVDFPINKIQKYIDKLGLKYIQLHGNESDEYIKKLKENNKIDILKVIGIENSESIKEINNFKNPNYFLFDYKPKTTKELPGGNAKQFNWNLVKKLKIKKNWFLSGGINEENIQNAINLKNLYGIDISSGVEEILGIKSIDKISRILKLINEYKK